MEGFKRRGGFDLGSVIRFVEDHSLINANHFLYCWKFRAQPSNSITFAILIANGTKKAGANVGKWQE